MKRLLMAGALAFAVAAGQALAADLPQPAPPPQAPVAYVPTVAPVYNWGGIYFGANGGYGFGSSEWSDPNNPSFRAERPVILARPGFWSGRPSASISRPTPSCSASKVILTPHGWMAKVQAHIAAPLGFGAAAQCETKNTWLGTVRARVGYAADRVLFYGTAGGAFGNIEAGANGGFVSSTKPGWTAGAGVEVAFADNWTARVEYLFVDLENAHLQRSQSLRREFFTTCRSRRTRPSNSTPT